MEMSQRNYFCYQITLKLSIFVQMAKNHVFGYKKKKILNRLQKPMMKLHKNQKL